MTSRAFLPHMAAQQQGNIINIGAPIEKLALPGFSAYAAAKWGVEGFTRALAKEVRRDGINVNALHPGGYADTRLLRQIAPEARKGVLAPDTITTAATFLATQEARGTSGEIINTYAWNKQHKQQAEPVV
jgi:3-oxoacyl-[acyl-carrier protein] reductase